MADVTTASQKPEATKPAPEVKPKTDATTKPEPKAEAKPDTSKTTDKPEPKTTIAPELRKRLAEVEQSDKAKAAEIESLRKQNAEYQNRRYVTPEMEKEIEANKAQMAELRRQLAETAYEKSDEFKQKYIEPYSQAKAAALEMVEQYQVTIDEDGNTRPATKADFLRVAQALPGERAAIARKLFGENSLNVLADIRDLERMSREANNAIKQHRDVLEAKTKQEQEAWEGNQKQFESARQLSRQQLAQEFPEFFGEPEDPDLAEAWKKGNEFVDSAAQRAADMSAEERAAVSEVMRARAAWFPRGHKENTKLKAENAQLKEELAKYRASDPGNIGERGDAKPKGDEDLTGGSESLVKRFEKMGMQ